MDNKLLLQELCSKLEWELNQRGETEYKRTVELFSGIKPSNCFLPQMTFRQAEPLPEKMAWFVEISVDGKVIFRESHIPMKGEDLEIIEGFLIDRIIRHIFTFGVMVSKKFLDDTNT